jgi:gelsolin
MSGLVKAKKYDWKDSNLAMFGSDTEKEVKKESAESEPAWQGAGAEVGLQIWRIVKFEVQDWPKEDYGKFYSGDSYIILNTYNPEEGSDELAWDVHFWIGSKSTQDEYGTAAYKTVELDTFLDDAAVQHREVQGKESNLFKTYYSAITIMEGGADSGFRHVKPEEYPPRLLHVSGKRRNVQVKEVPCAKSRLNSGDVFILDLGLQIYQWNGSECNKDERFKAMQYVNDLKSDRGNAEAETLDEADTPETHEFFDKLTEEDEDDDDEVDEATEKELFRVSDASGEMSVDKVKAGEITMDDFASDDVFILDCGDACFVWVGGNASKQEKKNGFGYATKYLCNTTHPLCPVSIVKEGQHSVDFKLAIAA